MKRFFALFAFAAFVVFAADLMAQQRRRGGGAQGARSGGTNRGGGGAKGARSGGTNRGGQQGQGGGPQSMAGGGGAPQGQGDGQPAVQMQSSAGPDLATEIITIKILLEQMQRQLNDLQRTCSPK